MKKYFYLLLITLLVAGYKGFTQTVPNAGFENWSVNTLYNEAPPFSSTNVYSYLSNEQTTVAKTTDAHGGTYAAMLSVDSASGNNVAGSLIIGGVAGTTITGGYPFAQKPDSLIGYVKYNLAGNDSAQVLIGFKRAGTAIGFGVIKFGGVSNSYTRFAVHISFLLPLTPDSMAALVGITSTGNAHASDVFYIDDISFNGTATPFPNGDFETWTPVATEDPDGWFTSNFFTFSSSPSAVKTTDKYSGTYAAELIVVAPPASLANAPTGFIIDGKLGNGGPVGGQPVSVQPVALTGYYKYAPMGNDTGIAIAYFHNWNTNTKTEDSVAEYTYYFSPAASYTAFTMPLPIPGVVPDSVVIGFSASDLNNKNITPTPGSTLKVDELAFQLSTGLSIPLEEYFKVNTLYPNPATETISLDYSLNESSDVTIKVYDVSGKVIRTISVGNQSSGQHKFDMNVQNLAAGTYFYSFNAGEKEAVKKFTIAR